MTVESDESVKTRLRSDTTRYVPGPFGTSKMSPKLSFSLRRRTPLRYTAKWATGEPSGLLNASPTCTGTPSVGNWAKVMPVADRHA